MEHVPSLPESRWFSNGGILPLEPNINLVVERISFDE